MHNNKKRVGFEVLTTANIRWPSWVWSGYVASINREIALMMEAASTSEMLINFYQTTWHYNPHDSHLQKAYRPMPFTTSQHRLNGRYTAIYRCVIQLS
jgi:hypothetical protein